MFVISRTSSGSKKIWSLVTADLFVALQPHWLQQNDLSCWKQGTVLLLPCVVGNLAYPYRAWESEFSPSSHPP